MLFALYFLLREVAQLRAMHKLGLAKNWFTSVWNYIDLLASGGTIAMFATFYMEHDGDESGDTFERCRQLAKEFL